MLSKHQSSGPLIETFLCNRKELVAYTCKWQHKIENTCSHMSLIYPLTHARHVHLPFVFRREVILLLIRDAQPTENTLLPLKLMILHLI